MQTGIYQITNTVSGKRYVGSAVAFRARWSLHRLHLRRGTHHSRHMQSSWTKHGESNFTFRPILVCAKKDLLMYEQICIDAFEPEFNVARVAGSCLGVKHSDETKRKLSLAKMGNTATLGHRHSPQTLARMSACKIGNTYTKGKTRSQQAVAKTAAAHTGMKRSDETRARIAAACLGRKMPPRSAEHCAALSAATRGKPRNPQSIAKMAATKRGSKLSAEHRARIGEASRRSWAARKAKDQL